MTQLQKQQNSQSTKYLNNLLGKNIKSSSRAQEYVAIKTVSVSQKLINGQQEISQKASQIKAVKESKNQPQMIKKSIKQIESQKQKLKNKILYIDNQLAKGKDQHEKKSPPKIIPDQERLKFVKQKRKQNLNISKRKEENLKQLQQKQKLIKQKQQEELIKKAQQLRQKKLQETRKKIEQIQKRKQQRILQNKKTNQILREKSKQKILAEKIQQNFMSNQNLLLDERKKKLAELRLLHKPMDRNEIEQHMKKFQQSRIQKSRTKESQKLNSSSQKANLYYRSVFHDILQRQSKQKVEKQTQEHYRIKQNKDKMKKYAQQIKSNYKPQINDDKRKQVQNRIKSSSLIQTRRNDNKMKGLEYLEFTKQYGVKNKKQEETPQNDKLLMRQEANKTHQTDYLAEIRKNNQSRLKRSVTSAQDFIKSVQKKNISGKEKQQKIMQFAQNLQRQARQKQSVLKSGQIEMVNEEVDKLYISAIEAKLKVLQA